MLRHLALFTCLSAFVFTSLANEPPTPLNVNLSRYAGVWFEYARAPNRDQDNTPSRDGKVFSACRATSVTYSIIDASSISLKNTCRRTASDGSTFDDNSTGIARVASGGPPNHLQIAFGSPFAQFVQRIFLLGGFDYWIFALGESEPTAPYTWALVSRPQRDYVFLLTRERFPSQEVQEQILAATRAAGIARERLMFAQ